MPWCEPCSKFYNPGSVEGHTCPQCGTELATGDVAQRRHEAAEETQERGKIPWHFWVGVVAMVIYLGWRLIQGITWLF